MRRAKEVNSYISFWLWHNDFRFFFKNGNVLWQVAQDCGKGWLPSECRDLWGKAEKRNMCKIDDQYLDNYKDKKIKDINWNKCNELTKKNLSEKEKLKKVQTENFKRWSAKILTKMSVLLIYCTVSCTKSDKILKYYW